MKITFQRLASRVYQPAPPGPDDIVAWYAGPDDREHGVPLRWLHPFQDLHVGHLRIDTRAMLLAALARPVTTGRLAEPLLDLSTRFQVRPDRDDRPWVVAGYRHVLTVDRKLVKHVLGAGAEDDAERDAWASLWSAWLGRPVDWRAERDLLADQGCDAWQRIADDPVHSDLVDLYGALAPSAAALCIAQLSDLRERFMVAVRDAVQAAGSLSQARHIHLDRPEQTVMHFLDDRGLNVICKGDPQDLAVATSFPAIEAGPSGLTPQALSRRRARLVHDIVRDLGAAAIHSPHAWGF